MFGEAQTAHRLEDQRFLTGSGTYLDDVMPEGCCAMYVLRSPQAHARIAGIELDAARDMPGVLDVVTAADLAAAGVNPLPCLAQISSWEWARPFLPPRPVLASDHVRYVGEPVVAVIAETINQARDAAEQIFVDYEELPRAVTVEEALDANAVLWPGSPDNVCFDWHSGDAELTESKFAEADRIVSLELDNNRVAGMSLETRGAIGQRDLQDGRYTLHVSSQGGHSIRRVLCQHVFDVPEENMRVITPDVGGGFGPKIFVYPEYALVLAAAARVKRPVKWVSDRSEALLSDTHGRGQKTKAELALDVNGRFLAMRFDSLNDVGAYPGQHGPNIATVAGDGLHPSVYDIQAVHVRVRGVFTNTVSTDSYRGAGRPEVIYAVERLVDQAARELGRDPAELRIANYLPRAAMPYTTVTNQTYDDGDFAELTRRAIAMSGFADRDCCREDAKRRGRLLGMGLAYFIDRCGRGLDEFAELNFAANGSLTLYCGSQNNGQGHETAYADIVARNLGLEREAIKVVQGDTDAVAFGRGTGGSRALAVGGNAVHLAVRRTVERLSQAMAQHLGCASGEIAHENGLFLRRNSNISLSFEEALQMALQVEKKESLSVQAQYKPEAPTFPNGCHVATIEIDPDTGQVLLQRYVSVNDVGLLLNQTLVEGQFHGGLVQGVSQALNERVVYDADSGQPLTGSLMDYYYPRAADFPGFDTAFVEIECKTNPLGVKGCGEAGAIAGPPAIANAVMDALSGYDTADLQMPFTQDKIFAVLQRGPRK